MDLQIKWSPEAVEDLESIADYIARDSAHYARAVVAEVLAAARAASEFPRAARVVPEIGDERIRERFVYSYRVVYRIAEEAVLIIAIIHGKRMMGDISDRFE